MKKVLMYIQQHKLIVKGDHIVVGVSGGADSVCLLFVLKELSQKIGFTMSAVHVNHHLRAKEAVRDEEFTVDLCKKLCIPCEVYHYDVQMLSGNWNLSIEETGRIVRQEAFEMHGKAYAKKKQNETQNLTQLQENGNIKIALAHHQNDVTETFLYHLARGTDIAGLCAIRPLRGEYIRPLLCMNRKEIEHYLKERNIEYVTDSTNEEDEYTRNKIRHHVVTYLEEEINVQAVSHVAQTAQSLEEVNAFLQELYEEKFSQYVHSTKEGYWISDELKNEKPILIRGVIRLVLHKAAGMLKDIERVHIMSVCHLFENQVGKNVNLPYQLLARREYDGVTVCFAKLMCPDNGKETLGGTNAAVLEIPGETIFEEYCFNTSFEVESLQEIPEKTYTKWFDYDKIKGNLVLRHRLSGDYLVVNTKGGRKKLKDYFINEKIPQKERDKIPLVCCGDHVAWVCGHRISELYKVDASTKRILKIQISAIHRNLKNIKGE